MVSTAGGQHRRWCRKRKTKEKAYGVKYSAVHTHMEALSTETLVDD